MTPRAQMSVRASTFFEAVICWGHVERGPHHRGGAGHAHVRARPAGVGHFRNAEVEHLDMRKPGALNAKEIGRFRSR